jgi:hypothetical protein
VDIWARWRGRRSLSSDPHDLGAQGGSVEVAGRIVN